MTTPKTDALMALADRYAFHIPGSQHSDEARAVLLAALQEQAREGGAVAIKDAVGCVLEGWTLPEPVRKILETAYYAAPQAAQPSEPAQPEQGEREAFERHWVATRGKKKASRELQRHSLQPQCYVQDSANRHWVTWQAALQSAQPVAQPLTPEELDLCRQWFDSIQDTNAEYLEPSDYLLAEKLYKQLNMRVPHSISEITKSGIGGKL